MTGAPGEIEQEFWLATARIHPGPMASLCENQIRVNPASISSPMRDVVREFLIDVLGEESSPGVPRQQQIVDALFVLNYWSNPDDSELLRRFLVYRHPLLATQKDESGAEIEVKDYPVRVQAARMLVARGEPISAEVAFRETSLIEGRGANAYRFGK